MTLIKELRDVIIKEHRRKLAEALKALQHVSDYIEESDSQPRGSDIATSRIAECFTDQWKTVSEIANEAQCLQSSVRQWLWNNKGKWESQMANKKGVHMSTKEYRKKPMDVSQAC